MSPSLTSLAYLVASVLFVLALRGLSSPVTSRQGNRFGMIGMGRSEEDPMRSNRMMRWRVILQAVALALAVLLISMLKS